MFNFATKGLSMLFGNKTEKDIRQITPYIQKINEFYEQLRTISDDALRGKTEELKGVIKERLKDIDSRIEELHREVKEKKSLNVQDKEQIFVEIDKLEKDRNTKLEVVLMDILPLAFAVVKETARRFTENSGMEVNVTEYDQLMARHHQHVVIQDKKAIWKNQFCNNSRHCRMRTPF